MTGAASDKKASLHPDVDSVLFDASTLQRKCEEIGAAIAKEYQDLKPLVLVTIAGAYMFAADVVRCIDPCPEGLQVDFIRASSYGSDTVSSGVVQVQARSTAPLNRMNTVESVRVSSSSSVPFCGLHFSQMD
jgi:hypoxanthine-guanine phosphoribosyltransferase